MDRWTYTISCWTTKPLLLLTRVLNPKACGPALLTLWGDIEAVRNLLLKQGALLEELVISTSFLVYAEEAQTLCECTFQSVCTSIYRLTELTSTTVKYRGRRVTASRECILQYHPGQHLAQQRPVPPARWYPRRRWNALRVSLPSNPGNDQETNGCA